jgi:hypothetical protein
MRMDRALTEAVRAERFSEIYEDYLGDRLSGIEAGPQSMRGLRARRPATVTAQASGGTQRWASFFSQSRA